MPARMTTADAPAARRLGALDGLRGIAALGVVVLHSWLFVRGDGHRPDPDLVDAIIGQLRLAVPLFFVLTGFLIFRPFARAIVDGTDLPALGAYARRRVARIGPAYWVVMLVAAGALAALGSGHAVPLVQMPVFLLFLQNYLPATAGHLNPPAWTVVIEVSYYASVPLVALLARAALRRRSPAQRRRALIVGGVVVLLVGGWLSGAGGVFDWPQSVRDTLPMRMPAFAVGMLAAVLVHGQQVRARTVSRLVLAGVTLVLAEAIVHAIPLGSGAARLWTADVLAAIGFGLVIAAIALGRIPAEWALSRGPLEYLGRVSYGMYLWHFPIIWVLRELHAWPGPLAAAAGLTVGLDLLFATASWYLLERHAIAWARGVPADPEGRAPVGVARTFAPAVTPEGVAKS